jgi:hypothetical protein
MKGSGLTAVARPAVWTIAACGCLSLSACSGAAPGARPDATTSRHAISTATQKFCQQIDNVMESVDSRGLTDSMTLTAARKDVDGVLKSVITDFKTLESQAPKVLRKSVRDVVTEFRALRRKSDRATSVSRLIADTTHESPVQTRAYLRVLAYAGRAC